MNRIRPALVLSTLGALVLLGCGRAPCGPFACPAPSTNPPTVSAGLVMPSPTLRGLSPANAWPLSARDWEFGRNNWAPAAATPAYAPLELVEIRVRDRQRTANGRPRDFSTTNTRSIRRILR